jgi:phage terminase Nu1 subunit (DNA packaging protein)
MKTQTEVQKLEENARKLAAARKIQKLQAEIKAEQAATTFILLKQDLAKILNISRPALDRALKKPGAPTAVEGKGWPLEAVRKWLVNTVRGTMVASRVDEDIGDLKRWEIYERARRMKVKNDQIEGTLILRTEVDRQWSHCISEAARVLDAIPQRLAVEIVGMTVADAEKLMQRAIDEAKWELHEGK